MKLRTVLLVVALVLLGLTLGVLAQDDSAAAAAAATAPAEVPATEANTEAAGEVPPADEGRPEKPNPWIKQKLSGLAIGENSALAIPVPVLIAIFFAFIAGVVYVILQIFESDKNRLRKADEKKAKREAKEAKKSVSSKKKA